MDRYGAMGFDSFDMLDEIADENCEESTSFIEIVATSYRLYRTGPPRFALSERVEDVVDCNDMQD